MRMSITTNTTSRSSTAFILAAFVAVLSLVQSVHAASNDDWRGRTVYQLVTDRFARTDGSLTAECDTAKQLYCGGTWQGIINKLDYIQGMGFTAIWISPIVENINDTTAYGQAYHGYWPKNIYALNENFGTADDLIALVTELHNRGMYLMIDSTLNNMANKGDIGNITYSDFTPFNSQDHYHQDCPSYSGYITDYSVPNNYQNCDLGDANVTLPDLNTESTEVINLWTGWVQDMIGNYSIDGLRLDALKHVAKPFWPHIQSAANMYTLGEVFAQDYDTIDYICNWQSAISGTFNYKLWYSMMTTFQNKTQSMSGLSVELSYLAAGCQDTTLLGTFTENHDVTRFAADVTDVTILQNAMTFSMLTDGIPVVYYGAEQELKGTSDPSNREALWLYGYNTSSVLYQHIKLVNTARNAMLNVSTFEYWSAYWTFKSKVISAQDDILAIRRGFDQSIVAVVTNRGSDAADAGPYELGDTNFVDGSTIVDLISCNTLTVGEYGVFNVTVTGGLPQVWLPSNLLVNATDVCPKVSREATSTSAATTNLVPSLSVLTTGLLLAACSLFT